jgi:hypothetical protein
MRNESRLAIAIGTALISATGWSCGSSDSPAGSSPLLSPHVFVGAGDIGMCGGDSELTAQLVEASGGTVFTLGDHAYPGGTRQEFQNCYQPTWGRFRNRTRPTPGNHDYNSPGAAPYFEYFGANAGPSGLGYYSFSVGAWHAIALNSNIATDAASEQAAWLRRDLAANPAACTLAYWHHSRFSSGLHGDNEVMRDVWRILYDAGADVVLSAHDHLYERFSPQDPDGRSDPLRGIRQFTVGTGGAPVYQFFTVRQNSEARIGALGVLRLTLLANNYYWEFVPTSGPGDSGIGVCH